MHKIFLIVLLAISTLAFAEGDFATNSPDVFVKNFICSSGTARFNVVNKSNKTLRWISIDIFDSAGDPLNRVDVWVSAEASSGKEVAKSFNCSKIQRIGFFVDFNKW